MKSILFYPRSRGSFIRAFNRVNVLLTAVKQVLLLIKRAKPGGRSAVPRACVASFHNFRPHFHYQSLRHILRMPTFVFPFHPITRGCYRPRKIVTAALSSVIAIALVYIFEARDVAILEL